MAKVSPLEFMKEVRAEIQKVTWPSRRETLITTAMVFVMASLAGAFFLLADVAIKYVINTILSWG